MASILMLALSSCKIPLKTAKVAVPAEDSSPPEIISAKFTVLGPGGRIYDINEVTSVGRINVEQALSITINAQDRESGVRNVQLSGEFLLWCGSTGIGPEQHWPINLINTEPAAEVGDSVRVTAGVSKTFKIADAYEETACTNPPARYQDLRGTFTLTATNYKGASTTKEYTLTIVPSPTGVTVLDEE